MAEHHSGSPEPSSVSGPESSLLVTIVTPFGTRAEYNVRHLRAPGVEGEFGVLPGHIPFITALKTGLIQLDLDKTQKYWAVSGGFAEILANRVTILAETAEDAESIDIERCEASRQRALKRLADRNTATELDLQRASASLNRAINRIRVATYRG